MNSINFWPILASSIVAFGINSLWYSPILFGKEWMTLTKLDDEKLESIKNKGVWKYYIVQFILNLLTFVVLAFIISMTNVQGSSNGAFVGFLAWLGFLVTNSIGNIIWERKPFKLVLITSVSNLLDLVIGGAIIGAWK